MLKGLYTREENLNCKLSDKDITEIRKLREGGNTFRWIGSKFGVTPEAIRYWINPKHKRWAKNNPEVAKKTMENFKIKNPTYHRDYYLKNIKSILDRQKIRDRNN